MTPNRKVGVLAADSISVGLVQSHQLVGKVHSFEGLHSLPHSEIAQVLRDRIQEARLRTENAQTTAGSVKSGITLDVRQAYLNLQTASRQIEAANAVLQQAIAARQLAEIRYQGQVGLFLEVTDAQSALVQAESSQVNAVYDYLVARANFDNALGTPQLR